MMMERGNAIVVFEGVPALLCAQCGDAVLEADVARQVQRLANQAFSGGATFERRTYVPA